MYKLLIITIASLFIGCAHNAPAVSIDGYKSLRSITQNGFAMNKAEARKLDGKKVKLWGYIDFANTYTCAMNNWYFSLKADKNAEAGESIHINTPAEYRFGEIYYEIRDMKKENKQTPVSVTGILHTFDAPENFSTLVGIEIDVKSPKDIEFK